MARDEDLAALLRDALAHEEVGWQSYEMALESVTQPEVRVELARLARDGQARAALVRRLLRSTARRAWHADQRGSGEHLVPRWGTTTK